MDAALGIRRVLGCEKKKRKPVMCRLEEEFVELINENRIARTDFINMSVQRFINRYGKPLFLISITGDSSVQLHPLNPEDIINLAVGEMLVEKGYLR